MFGKRGERLLDNAENVAFLHDQKVLAVDFHFGARPFAEQDAVASFDFQRDDLIVVTARAGADGVAVSFVAPDEKPYIRDIERLTRIKLAPLPLPEDFQKEAARLPAPSRKAPPQPQGAGKGNRRAGGANQGGAKQGGGQKAGGKRRDDRRHERPQGERPRGEGERGERREREAGDEQGQRKRSFRPRGPKGMGAHKNKVRRAG